MHVICDPCFQKVGPLEELTIGIIGGTSTCAYCGSLLTTDDNLKSHRLAGDAVRPPILHKLGFEVFFVVYARLDEDRTLVHALKHDGHDQFVMLSKAEELQVNYTIKPRE